MNISKTELVSPVLLILPTAISAKLLDAKVAPTVNSSPATANPALPLV